MLLQDPKNLCISQRIPKIILTAHKNDAYRNILAITFTNSGTRNEKRIVGSLSEFAKDEPSKKAADLMQDLSTDTGLSIIEIKKQVTANQSTSFTIMRHLIFRPSINLHTK
jgi:ATP-dependent exoDNAse (exonuclease V) beta subunit